jgi:hypothetical protein
LWYNENEEVSQRKEDAPLTVFLIIITVLCIILLLPIRVRGSFGDGKWAVSVHYTFFRVFHKESAPEPPPPETPHIPNPDADTPAQPDPTPEPAEKPKKKRKKKKKPAKPAESPKPETVSEPVSAETLAGTPESADLPASSDSSMIADIAESAPEAPEKPKKKRGIKAFIARIKPHSVSDVFGLIKDGGAALSPSLRFLTRHLHFRHVKLYLAVGSDDPANTAQLYGKICAAVYNLLGAMLCWVDLEADEFRILADFFNPAITFRISLELRCSPAALLLTVLMLGGRFLWRTWRRFRREDKEAARREKETAPLPAAEHA